MHLLPVSVKETAAGFNISLVNIMSFLLDDTEKYIFVFRKNGLLENNSPKVQNVPCWGASYALGYSEQSMESQFLFYLAQHIACPLAGCIIICTMLLLAYNQLVLLC